MGQAAQCRLLGGAQAWFAQATLGLIALGALVYKRQKEKPQRPLGVWSFDVAKQLISLLVAHVCGMLIAAMISLVGHHSVSECAWYFVAFAFDTTLGVTLTLVFHKIAVSMASKRRTHSSVFERIAECGNYGTPPTFHSFWPQLIEWVLAVLLARFVCGFVVMILKRWLVHIAKVLDIIFAGSPIALLYFVMICCPLLMNLFQALVQDMALKWKQGHEIKSPLPTTHIHVTDKTAFLPANAPQS